MGLRAMWQRYKESMSNCSARPKARLAQSVERKALNLVVVGSRPTVGAFWFFFCELSHALKKLSIS